MNWDWYRKKYPIVAQLTDKQCEKHYKLHGKKLGLNDQPIIWNERKEKLYTSIRNCKTKLPKDFTIEGYKTCNIDITNESDLFVIYHYLYYGINEQRKYKSEICVNNFNSNIYRELNSDLVSLSENQLISHYIHYGSSEKRQCEDDLFDEKYFIERNNILDINNAYNTYVQDIRLFKSRKVENIIENILFCKKDYILISHNGNINGASHSLYILANFLKSKNNNIIILDTKEPTHEIYQKYNLSVEDFGCYYNDPTILYWYCFKIKSLKIIVNSINHSISAAIKWLDRSNLLLFSRETKTDYMSFSCYEPDVVITKSISNSYETKPFIQTPICPPFLQEKIYRDYKEEAFVDGLDQTKITLGMCGSLTQRKNYKLFLEIAKELPSYNFIWIGGDKLDTNISNVFHIADTTNPFKYYKLLDYFLLCSEVEPFGNVVIENLLLNKKILTFRENMCFDFKHKLTKDNYFEFEGSFSIENAIKHIKQIATTKQQINNQMLNTPSNLYVVKYFSSYKKEFLQKIKTPKLYLNQVKNVTDKRHIYVKCPMGFCNQLRLMLAGCFLVNNNFISSYTQEWLICDDNNVDYLTYFEPLPGVKLSFVKERIDVKSNNIINTSCFGTMVQHFTNNTVNVKEAFNAISPLLKLKASFKTKIDNFIKKYNLINAIGLHLRETDKAELYGKENIVSSFEQIINLCKSYEKVFLATDNKKTQYLYQKNLGEKLITFENINKNLINNSKRYTTPLHSVADFILLQNCKHFYGTNRSSFSTLVKHIRNNPADYAFIENL